jgi:pimeloyl-ACP methyl ester carboxylesterase
MRPWFNAPIVGSFLLAASIIGCAGAGTAPTDAPAATTGASAPTSIATPAATVVLTPLPTLEPIVGTFDARGHKLYLKCEGGLSRSGLPTIVYLHGMSPEPPDSGVSHGDYIARHLTDTYRFCSYDRANIGGSDTVAGKQTAHDAVLDLHALLESAGVSGPYVLLGASFGGLVAYEYAVSYPDQVVGLVVLDPTLPREYLDIDPYYHPDDGLLTGNEWKDNREHMDWLGSMQETQVLEGTEPKIPLTYFEIVHPETWWHPVTDESIKAYRAMQQRFIDLWTPGTLVTVDTPHYMEPVIPDVIAKAVRDLLAGLD